VPRELLVRPTQSGLLWLTAREWAWLLALQVGMARVPALTPLLVVLAGGRLHALGIILHDAMHQTHWRGGWRLRLLSLLAGGPVAITLEAMRYHHLRHHRDAQLASDPYLLNVYMDGGAWGAVFAWLMLLPVEVLWVLRGPVGLLAWALPPLRNLYGRVFLLDRSGRNLTHSEELLTCARAELGQVLFHLGLLALAWHWPWPVVRGFVLPLAVLSVLSAYRLLIEHTRVRATGRSLADVFAGTKDHGLGWLGRLVLAPLNIGYHVVHHLHPQVSLVHLPRLREWYLRHYPAHYPPARRF
jgi:fatty acid desaturase